MRITEIGKILNDIHYKDGWRITLDYNRSYMQVILPPDPDGNSWSGRKWLVSTHMTEGEIVQTALLAFLAAEEHEAREAFHYKGMAIFGPHLNINVLLERAEDIEMRKAVA